MGTKISPIPGQFKFKDLNEAFQYSQKVQAQRYTLKTELSDRERQVRAFLEAPVTPQGRARGELIIPSLDGQWDELKITPTVGTNFSLDIYGVIRAKMNEPEKIVKVYRDTPCHDDVIRYLHQLLDANNGNSDASAVVSEEKQELSVQERYVSPITGKLV